MKRKYYLRGLGFGILITSLVFIIANPTGLSDEEIIKRAEELGYVMGEAQTDSLGIKDLLGTVTPKEEEIHTVTVPDSFKAPTPTLTPVPLPTEEEVRDDDDDYLEEPEETVEPEEPTPEPTITPTPIPTEVPAPVITATIIVERGNTATMVCEKIEAAGIVKSGDKLRDYLVEHDLADYINIGSYTLSDDMSLEEIADIIAER